MRCGIDVKMSRTDDTRPSLESRWTAANSWDAHALVSVHANATTGSARGIELLYQTSDDRALAEAIYPFVSAVSSWEDRGLKYRDDLQMLNGATMPATIVEYGFLTNPAEEALLATTAYQTLLAEATCRGVCAYFSVPYVP